MRSMLHHKRFGKLPRLGFVPIAADSGGDDMPAIGDIKMVGGAIGPKWLECDGTAVSRSSYGALFAYLGTAWGPGDGSSTFNLPDLRGRAPIGVGAGSGLTARALAEVGGVEAVSLTGAQSGVPAHQHAVGGLSAALNSTAVTINDPGHSHADVAPSGGTAPASTGADFSATVGPPGNTTGSAGTGMTAAVASGAVNLSGSVDANSPADAASPHQNMPPFAAVRFAIYAAA